MSDEEDDFHSADEVTSTSFYLLFTARHAIALATNAALLCHFSNVVVAWTCINAKRSLLGLGG
jgi:hypothetical protein